MSGLAFVDTETTGLDPDLHEIWEVALVVDDVERVWHLPVDLGRADPYALEVGRYYDRPDWGTYRRLNPGVSVIDYTYGDLLDPLAAFAHAFAGFTRGRHLVGAVVSFDAERLTKLLRKHGACPGWHYHLIDVEALAVGWLFGKKAHRGDMPSGLPWKSEDLSRAVGVNPDDFERHTALGDARWAKAIYEAVTS